MNNKICPRCTGNGYIKVKKEVGSNKDIVVQCTMCESQGELDEKPSYDYNGVDLNKLQ